MQGHLTKSAPCLRRIQRAEAILRHWLADFHYYSLHEFHVNIIYKVYSYFVAFAMT